MLDTIVGQSRIKESLKINIGACRIKNTALPHILFCGFAGGGKTLFSRAIAEEMNVDFQESNGSVLSNVKTLLPFLARIKSRSIFFIDEIHACNTKVFEYLLTAMLEFKMQVGDMVYPLPSFTLVGATTNPGKIIKPLRDRFVLQYALERYNIEDIKTVIRNNVSVPLTETAIELLANTSRGIPRIALNRLKFINNYAINESKSEIGYEDVEYCLGLEGVNKQGITRDDIKYLKVLKGAQPCGIGTLEASTGFSRDYIENVVEPYLLSKQVIIKTGKGRKINESIKI